jgi:hypothetical protein
MRAVQPDPHDAGPAAAASRPSYNGARETERRAATGSCRRKRTFFERRNPLARPPRVLAAGL